MRRILILLLFGVLVSAGPCFALVQEHAEGAAAEHQESPWLVVARWANFIVLFGGLGYLLRKPMAEFFETRRKEIGSGLQRAQEAQATAQARMNDIEQRLARLSTEIAALRAEAEKESLVEREKIITDAKREVDRVIEQSRQEIDRVARSLEREIKETIADAVIDRAGKTLRTEMTQDDQKRVIVRFIKKL